jgi:tetrahydromethanopterin:alpha-L-glutamate ligase
VVRRLRIGIAGIPGAWSTEQLRAALCRMDVESPVFNLAECSLDLETGAVWSGERDLGTLDGVIVKKLGPEVNPLTATRIPLLRQLESRGVRVFSSSSAIAEANDRFGMTQRLAQAGIPLPRTVITESLDTAARVVARWDRTVLKPLYTSKGRGMLLVSNRSAYRLMLRRWHRDWGMPFYLQEYVPSGGRDIGVAILAGRVVGAYYRAGSSNTWLTTTASGGHYERCDVSPDMERLALSAADLFGLTFTVVDLVKPPGGYLVYEVSAFGGFAGLWKSHAIDAASLYAEHVVSRLTGSRVL